LLLPTVTAMTEKCFNLRFGTFVQLHTHRR
jgi:hypothetical protein